MYFKLVQHAHKIRQRRHDGILQATRLFASKALHQV